MGILKDPVLINDIQKESNFMAGRIHLPRYRDAWLSLGISKEMELMIADGYRLPFDSYPGPYFEENNATVRNNMQTALEVVQEMEKVGVIEFVSERPYCVNPLGLVTKIKDGIAKHLLIFDASRWINLKITPRKITLSHLERLVHLIEENDLISTFDLQSCYYHVKIHADFQKYLGAAIQIKGKTCYFQYKHLPFGLNSAVHCITKIWKPVLAAIHKQGVRFEIYIDDGIILANDVKEMLRSQEVVYDLLVRTGWVLAKGKSDSLGQASRSKQYLGFILDTAERKIFATETKLGELKTLIVNNLVLEKLPIKEFASIAGKITSLILSHGQLARVCNRSAYKSIDDHVAQHGWKNSIGINETVKREWEIFIDKMDSLNGTLFSTKINEIRVDSFISNPEVKKPFILNKGSPQELAFSDASSWKAAVVSLTLQVKKSFLNLHFKSMKRDFPVG